MFQEGQQIGLYTLIRKLGRGGFGEVWLAERKSKFVTTKVAVKLPLDEQVDHEAIKQEATLWEQASGHPNILPIIDADEYDGQIVIVSEYAPDGSLEEWLKTHGKMPIEKAVETTIKILDGLDFLHSRNIIHRDLKPANILLQGETPRLADFGISRALRTTASSQSSNVSGTFAYMPPEGFDGKRSAQTDIWSIGINLYQLLTGNLPYPQKEPSALIAAIMMRDFEPLSIDIPQSLHHVIAKALAKQPENRYKTAKEMGEDLRRVLLGESIGHIVQLEPLKAPQLTSDEAISPIQKKVPILAVNTHDERETVVKFAPSFGQSDNNKTSNIWIYAATALVLISAIGTGVYFLITKQTKQNHSNKIESLQISTSQLSNNSTNSENVSINTTVAIFSESPTPTPIPDKAQFQKVLNQYIKSVEKKLNQDAQEGFIYKAQFKDIVYGDVDKDADEDAIAHISFRDSVNMHISTVSSKLVVFSNNNGQFTFATDIDPGIGVIKTLVFKNGKILLTTIDWTSDDPSCCPSIKNQLAFSLQGNRLERTKR